MGPRGACVDIRGPLSQIIIAIFRRLHYVWDGRRYGGAATQTLLFIMTITALPTRLFRCRLDELGPLSDMVQAMFSTNEADFGKASPDYADPDFLGGWNKAKKAFDKVVPTGVHQALGKESTQTVAAVAKNLRDPLNWLNIRLNKAAQKKALTVAVDDFGLGQVRNEISTHDLEGLDGALNHLLQLVQEPQNLAALTAQGHAPADTKALADARQQLNGFNTARNQHQNAGLELTEENLVAGNALWHYLSDVLGTGNLMYKETQPKKARTFTLATLKKRIRKENGGNGDVQPMPGVA